MADVLLLLVMSLLVRHDTGGKIEINHDYLTRMVAELRTLCPYNDGCKEVPDWQLGQYYAVDIVEIPVDESETGPVATGRWSCCSWCYCDDSCVEMGRCCPEYFLEHFADGDAIDEIPFVCAMNHLKVPDDGNRTFVIDGRFKIDKCLEIGASDDALRLKCEQRNISNIDEVIPVFSMDSGQEYVNVFCARCNGDTTNVISLSAYAGSNEPGDDPGTIDKYIQQNLNWQEIYKLTYDPNSDLNLYFGAPDKPVGGKTIACVAPVIYDCNVTGLWQTYDPYYEFACKVYRANYYYAKDIFLAADVFSNAFCMVCNGMTPIADIRYVVGVSKIESIAYMALLNYRDQDTSDVPIPPDRRSCPDTDFYDPLNNICRPWSCPRGSTYNGQTCISALYGKEGGHLLFLLKVRPVGRQALPSDEELLTIAEYIISTVFLEHNSTVPEVQIRQWIQLLQVNMLANSKEESRSDLYDLVFLFLTTVYTKAAESSIYTHRYLAAMNDTQTHTFTNNGSLVTLTITDAENIRMQKSLDAITLVSIDDGTTLPSIFTGYRPLYADRIIRVKKIDHCLLFTLRQDEYVAHLDHITMTTVDATFYITQYNTYDVNQSVCVCVQDYLDALKTFTNEAQSQTFHILYLSIFAVFCLSD